MRYRLTLPILFFFAIAAAAAAGESSWRENIDRSLKASTAAMRADSVDVLTISIITKKDGEEKSRDTSRTKMFSDGDDQVILQLDETGVVVDSSRRYQPEGSVSQAGILSMFHRENADIYTLDSLGHDDSGHLKIAFAPVKAADSLYSGVAYVDTSAWMPDRMEMAPSELPSKVKEMEMVARFAPGGDGLYRPQSMVVTGRAKWLLINVYFRTETHYTW